MSIMEVSGVIEELEKLITSRVEIIEAIRRKKWLPSEKAATSADHMAAIDALHFAIGALKVHLVEEV